MIMERNKSGQSREVIALPTDTLFALPSCHSVLIVLLDSMTGITDAGFEGRSSVALSSRASRY